MDVPVVAGLAIDDVQRVDHCAQGIAQFVREFGQELVLAIAVRLGLLELLPLAPEPAYEAAATRPTAG